MLRQNKDHCPGCSQGGVQPGAAEDLQLCDQAGAQALPQAGVCRCAQGGLHQVQAEPDQENEACDQEVVLHPVTGVRTCLVV